MDLMDPLKNFAPVWGLKADEVEDIEYTTDNPNKVSQEKLFPINFSKSPISGGQFIERSTMNGIFKTLTKQHYNDLLYRGMAPYSEIYCKDVGYPLGAFVKVLYDTVTGQLTCPSDMEITGDSKGLTAAERRQLATVLTLQSMVDDNKNSAYSRENLNKYWLVDDGNPIGTLKQSAINMPPPPGYLDLGYKYPTNGQEPLFALADYPRVAVLLKSEFADCCPFEKRGNDQFTIRNYAGLFLRVFNNGYVEPGVTPRDPGRSFNEIQKDTMCPLIGAVALLGYNSNYSSRGYGTIEQSVVRQRTWMPVTEIVGSYVDDPKYAHLKDLKNFNVFKPIVLPTNYQLSNSSYENYGVDYSSFSDEGLKSITGHVLTFDSSDHPNTGHEVRPKNACMKLFIKI